MVEQTPTLVYRFVLKDFSLWRVLSGADEKGEEKGDTKRNCFSTAWVEGKGVGREGVKLGLGKMGRKAVIFIMYVFLFATIQISNYVFIVVGNKLSYISQVQVFLAHHSY